MARILRAASVLAVSSNLDMIRSRPYLRFRLPLANVKHIYCVVLNQINEHIS